MKSKTLLIIAAMLLLSISVIAQTAYITNTGSNTVSVINVATNTVTASISIGSPFGISVSPDGSKVYVAQEYSSGTVSVINTATNSISATIIVGVYYTNCTTTVFLGDIYLTSIRTYRY